MSELLPCPFCGGEAETLTAESMHGGYLFGIMCNDCRSRGDVYDTEDEAIAAWNTRAAYEMEGWFYLPKPKQRLFDYTTGFSFDDVSLKATGTVGVYALADAVRKWQEEELNQHIIERICEVFKPERTCENKNKSVTSFWCSKCDAATSDGFADVGGKLARFNYCPNCGARRVGE